MLSFNLSFLGILIKMYKTRGSNRVYYNIACRLPSFEVDEDAEGVHTLEEEVPLYDQFLNDVCDAGAKFLDDSKKFLMSSGKGIWLVVCKKTHFIKYPNLWFPFTRYSKLVRFKNNNNRRKYVDEFGKLIWTNKAVSLSSAVKDLRHLMAQSKKPNSEVPLPIGVFIGQGCMLDERRVGHAVCLILSKDEGGWSALMKDCLPQADAKVVSHVVSLCKALGIHHVSLVPQLEDEMDRTGVNCIQEGYRVIGDVLDGKHPDYLLPYVTEVYNVFSRKPCNH
jgi:hypothetical protein